MNVRLTQPLPTINGRVLPIGLVIDAPPGFKERLVADGKAVWVGDVHSGNEDALLVPTSPVEPKTKQKRKKVEHG